MNKGFLVLVGLLVWAAFCGSMLGYYYRDIQLAPPPEPEVATEGVGHYAMKVDVTEDLTLVVASASGPPGPYVLCGMFNSKEDLNKCECNIRRTTAFDRESVYENRK